MDIPLLLWQACISAGMDKSKVTYFGAIVAALIILSGAAIVPLLPRAEATTIVVSSDNSSLSMTVDAGDTLIIDPGVNVGITSLTNYGTSQQGQH